MIVSLNEVETIAYKASRGAGLAWGTAEDVAVAARWLAQFRLPWAASLVQLLSRRNDYAPPVLSDGRISPTVAELPLCPLLSGIAVSDFLVPDAALVVSGVAQPHWMLPFASRHAGKKTHVLVEWDDTAACLVPDAILASATIACVATPATCRVSIVQRPPPTHWAVRLAPGDSGIDVEDEDWTHLTELEARTYVPASLQSRIAGAGAGVSDND